MNIPGFTGEASLYRTSRHYQTAVTSNSITQVLPQLVRGRALVNTRTVGNVDCSTACCGNCTCCGNSGNSECCSYCNSNCK